MEIELKKFGGSDYFRFLKLTLDTKYSKELENSFFGYIIKGIKKISSRKKDYKFIILVNRRFAGSISIYKNKSKDYELGFFILREYRNKGIATKSTKLILNRIKLKSIRAITTFENKGAIKCLEKNDFKIIKRNKKENELIFEKVLK